MGTGTSHAGGGRTKTSVAGGRSSAITKAREEAFKKLEAKGNTITDYYVTPTNTIIALVKSSNGNFSLRQSFLMGSGDKYQGFQTFRLLRRYSESAARMEYEDVISRIPRS